MDTTTQTAGTDNGLATTTWTVTDDQGEAASITVEATTGLILSVDTREDRRGEGLARHLYEYAASVMDIYHVPVWGCTEDGQGFAEAMGGETMDDETAAQILGLDLEDVLGITA